jgi:excisionase family DNA binding protein
MTATDRRPSLDVAGIAHYLGTSVRHVRRLVAERRIPHHKVGGLVRFDPNSIDRWLAENERTPPARCLTPSVRSNPRRRPAQAVPSDSPPHQMRFAHKEAG